MLFRIPLRIPFAYYSMACPSCARNYACYRAYYGPYYGAYHCACNCAYYGAYSGAIRLIFKLLTIYRVTEPAEPTDS